MSEIINKDEKISNEKVGEDFFLSGKPIVEEKKPEKPLGSSTASTDGSSFVSKGSNKVIEEPYNIHFTISGKMFLNIIEFINGINYKCVFQFKQKEMNIMIVDDGNTHLSSIKFDKLEFSDYNIKNLENENSEIMIFIDMSIITDELSVDDSHPIDFYVDTLINNRFYVVCGKESVYKQLNTTNILGDPDGIFKKYNSLKEMVKRVITEPNYQRIVVSQTSLTNLIKSLSKKKSKNKDEVVGCLITILKNKLIFTIKNETKGSDIDLSGEDILVYPTAFDKAGFNVDYFVKFGKLKTSYTTTLYLHDGVPLIFESRLGGGSIILHYLIAPRAV